jgi:glutamine synthetase
MLDQIKRDEIEFISLQLFDLIGVPKEVIIPAQQFETAIKHGVWFDGSSIEGFARIQESDLFLKPDLSTYAVVPWLTENGRTARLICDIYKSDGEPFADDPRHILRNEIQDIAKLGYQYNVGPELEFYLFKKEEALTTNPVDYHSYFDMSSHQGFNIIKEIINALKSFGIEVETAHHEVGKGLSVWQCSGNS